MTAPNRESPQAPNTVVCRTVCKLCCASWQNQSQSAVNSRVHLAKDSLASNRDKLYPSNAMFQCHNHTRSIKTSRILIESLIITQDGKQFTAKHQFGQKINMLLRFECAIQFDTKW